ncbi:MAG: copper-translocating P-type ATPase [Candidatus Aenigmarchaeota archaeon]|nr:copper-translocating P-type ATPase [Candidatus Aenigmarchaeota archaeon]MDI6721995.1 copper-translocating P-type ATPase [Candidatus Aenigmarchaeota archaeon]
MKKTEKCVIGISGMHCASCAGTIEKKLKKRKGIVSASVNFASEKAAVEYDPSKIGRSGIISAINDTGYKAIDSSKNKVVIKAVGMDSPHCAMIVEKALKSSKGIISVETDTANQKAIVEYDPSAISTEAIKKTIKDAGYEPLDEESYDREKEIRLKEMKALRQKFLLGAILSVPIFLGSFPEWFPFVPSFLTNHFVLLILTLPVQFWVGSQFYRGAWIALRNRTADMNTLIAVGTSAAFLYSAFATFFPSVAASRGEMTVVYYDTAAIIITLIILGRYLEAIAKGRTSEAIKKLMKLQAKTAIVVRKGREIEIPVEEVVVGDIIIVKPGGKMPVDGVVIEGYSAVDESMITGESMPAGKKKGDAVIGATINRSGLLRIRATKVGKDTMLAQIIKIVEEAQGSKAPIQRLADRVSSYFVPAVILIALASFAVWLAAGMPFIFAFTILIAVLIIACPCALGLATPTAIMIGTGKGAEHGILIKNGESLETAHKITTVIFDKTGTLTKGQPEVTDVIGDKDVLKFAAAAEKGSEHPLGEAIVKAAQKKKIKIPKASGFHTIGGKGIIAKYGGKKIIAGSRSLMKEKNIKHSFENEMQRMENEGKTVVIVAVSKKAIGIIAIADTLKENSREAIEELKKMGKEVVMITGDNERTANTIAKELGISRVLSQVLPGDKAREVKKLQKEGHIIAFVGDGINDAPALAQADVGIAIGSGTDIALETGGIVLVKNDLRDVVSAIRLSRYTIKKIKQNLFWAFIYNTAGIPIAAGLLYPFSGFLLNPIIAAAAMAFSSVSVVGNSLLMKRFRMK